MKLGKLPPTHDDRDLRFARYVTVPKVRTAPKGFGHHGLVPRWGMLKNDELGDCEIARQLHAVMLWNATVGRPVEFTDSEAVRVYSAVTGYVPGDRSTDRGTRMRDCLRYAQKIGVTDSNGNVHRIGAYLRINPKDTTQLLRALYLCQQVAIGFEVPRSAMRQAEEGKPWTLNGATPNDIIGGHAVEIVARPTAEAVDTVTWGKLQRMTFGFYRRFNDEAWAVISEEALNADGRTLEGFNLEQLQADLANL